MIKTHRDVPESDVGLLFQYLHTNARVEDMPKELWRDDVEKEILHERQNAIIINA